MKGTRQNDILKMLMIKQHLRTEQLVQEFNVSIETIRRDINDLEKEGLIRKVYGGIRMIASDTRITVMESWNKRLESCHAEKLAIAGLAMEIIPDNATIALDTGSTVYELSRLLGSKKNLTIITNSLNIASELSQNTQHTIYSVGGMLGRGEIVTGGSFACSFLDNFSSVDLFICGADGFTLENGITEFNENMVEVKRRMIILADRVIALMDHSKFGKKSLFKSCSTQDIDLLVTDSRAPRDILDGLLEYGVEVALAGE